MERKFHFVPGEYYHIFNRGIDKREIFKDPGDWDRFQDLLYLGNNTESLVFKLIQGLPLEHKRGPTLASILGYCMMPNHFHLIVREDAEGGVSRMMGKIATSYSMYFNTKYQRTGALLCHPFRARHIDDDAYFRWVFSYVHLNSLDVLDPTWRIKSRKDLSACGEKLRSYKYSSYGDYFGDTRLESKIIERRALPIDVSELEDVGKLFDTAASLQGLPLE